MAPYIFMERNGIHIIDLHKTAAKIDEAAQALKGIAKSGKQILFVATKKQAKEIIAERAAEIGMPYVIERWPGGMLTNFLTIRKAVKKMSTIDKMNSDGTIEKLSKRERLQISRQRAKLEKELEYQRKFLAGVRAKLSNEKFMNNAKQEAIDKELSKKAEFEEKIEKAAKHIDVLKSF